MFFKICNKTKSETFPFSRTIVFNDYTLFLDLGWQEYNNIYFKGYCIGKSLYEKVQALDFAEDPGNYCIIDLRANPSIFTDDSRAFPLFYKPTTISNHFFDNAESVWVDSTVEYKDNQWHFVNYKNKQTFSNSDFISYDKCVDTVCEELLYSCKNLQTNLPIRIANSHGVDSVAVQSALDYLQIKYEPVDANSGLKNFASWGYNQIFVDHKPHVQATGFCGDELVLRNPMYCHWLLKPHNINLIDEYNKVRDSYMLGFYQKKYKNKILSDNVYFHNIADSRSHVYNVASNDFQMWHFNNVITFTPFRNLKLAKKLLQADPDTVIKQVVHADLSFDVIKRLNKKNIQLITHNKNNVTIISCE